MLVPLSDPTWFAPVINYVKSIAEHMKSDQNNYLVLLIITDGGIEGTIDLHFLIFISNEHRKSMIALPISTRHD